MNRHLRMLVAGIALIGGVAAAQADSVPLVFLGSGPAGRYDLRLHGVNMNDVNASWLKFGIGSPSATDYLLCTELTQRVAPRGDFKSYQKIEKNGEIGWLLNQYEDVMANGGDDRDARAAGLQAAIWEVRYEGEGGNDYDLSDGKFRVRDADNSLGEKGLYFAKRYLEDMNGNTADYILYHHDKYQDMVGTAPVPEPATFAALGAGLLLFRRRKRKA